MEFLAVPRRPAIIRRSPVPEPRSPKRRCMCNRKPVDLILKLRGA
jgi:hypothetical protein